MSTGDKTSGGEGGIRTLDTGVSPYNGLAIAHQFAMHNVLKGLQSGSEAVIRGASFSIGTKCSPFCSLMLINRPVGSESTLEGQPGAGWVKQKSKKSGCCDRREKRAAVRQGMRGFTVDDRQTGIDR
jgi:hypothetical protein